MENNKWKQWFAKRNIENYEKYKEQRTIVENIVRKTNESSWKEFVEKLKRENMGNQKLFYIIINVSRPGKKTNKGNQNAIGEVIADDKEILKKLLLIKTIVLTS